MLIREAFVLEFVNMPSVGSRNSNTEGWEVNPIGVELRRGTYLGPPLWIRQ